MRVFDSHNHLQSGRFGMDTETLISEMRDAGITGCVVNATCEEDWEKIEKLADKFAGFVFPAYGIHPWFAHTAEAGWEERLVGILQRNPQASVGEIGVDGWVDFPEMSIQKEIFSRQIEIAASNGRIMTVHCLKAWEELFQTMDEVEAWPEKFLMHSFGGSIEIAERLLKKGAWFSFSGYFLHQRKRKVLEVFKKLPQDRILLETDAPDMMPPEDCVKFSLTEGVNHPGNLASIAAAFKAEMGADILRQIRTNQNIFWGF